MTTLKIIKIGGEIVDNEAVLSKFLTNYAALEGPKILVHGGGKLATKLAETLKIPVTMLEGRRITDQDTLEVATMVYAGKINKGIVAQLQKEKCNAMGLSGADANVITSEKRPVTKIDYGFVGDIIKVNHAFIKLLLDHELAPVFCAITHDAYGQLLNTNADTIASELAIALSSNFNTELFYCFGKQGVLKDMNDEGSVINSIDTNSYALLKEGGIISEGMIPKLDNCFNAVANGVQQVHIGKPEMLFKDHQLYTTITK